MSSADAPLPTCDFPALRDHLLAHSVQRGDFTLKSGKRSEWFIDAKATTCSPDGMLLVADALLSVLPDDVTALGGLTVGADAAAYATAGIAATRGRMLKAFTVRKEAKGHGMGGRVPATGTDQQVGVRSGLPGRRRLCSESRVGNVVCHVRIPLDARRRRIVAERTAHR